MCITDMPESQPDTYSKKKTCAVISPQQLKCDVTILSCRLFYCMDYPHTDTKKNKYKHTKNSLVLAKRENKWITFFKLSTLYVYDGQSRCSRWASYIVFTNECSNIIYAFIIGLLRMFLIFKWDERGSLLRQIAARQ